MRWHWTTDSLFDINIVQFTGEGEVDNYIYCFITSQPGSTSSRAGKRFLEKELSFPVSSPNFTDATAAAALTAAEMPL